MFDIFYRCYPYKLFLAKDGQNAVETILETFDVSKITKKDSKISNIDKKNEEQNSVNISIKYADNEIGLNVSKLVKRKRKVKYDKFIKIIFHLYILLNRFLAETRT